MKLDRISAVVRPRGRWQAIDLGLLMARAWWGPLMRVWLVVTLPALTALHLLPVDLAWVAILIFWWFKPLWERPLLHILGQALFGEIPPLRQTLKAFPRLAMRQGLADLLWRRFSPARSMNLPVSQLEGLAGGQRRQRLHVLHGLQGSGGGWLTLVGVHLELFFSLALLTLILLFVPPELRQGWEEPLLSGEPWVDYLINAVSYVAMSLVAPFYVAAGFSLYIHRRIWLEGWDIEIAFRRLRQRLDTAARRPPPVTAARVVPICLVGVLVAAGVAPAPLQAQEREPLTPAQARSQIEAVLAGDEFHQREIERSVDWPWQWGSPDIDLSWLAEVVAWLAQGGRLMAWAVALALLLIFLFKQRQWLRRYASLFGAKEKRGDGPPAVLFGLEVTAATLPDDVPGQVRQLWQAGAVRQAYALLYRATLTRLMTQRGVVFEAGDTERDCVRRVRRLAAAELSDFFTELTDHWQRLAYGHRTPQSGVLERHCQRWQQLFGEASHEN